MNQRDLSELRRRLNPDKKNPTVIRGCYVDHTGQVMGDAHRAAYHDFKEDSEIAETEEITEDVEIEEDSLDGGEDCEDGLDL